MDTSVKDKAIQCINAAVADDNAGNYEKALEMYTQALEYLKVYLKYEKNPSTKQTITEKFTQYLSRAEDLKKLIDTTPHHGQSGHPIQSQKTKGSSQETDAAQKALLQDHLSESIVMETPNVSWDDVAGLESAKDALKEAVILPVKFPHFFTGKRKAWSGFLLYGPPGTGKSYLAKAVATEAKSTFFSLSASDLVSKWVGESEKLVAILFELAREKAPSIIFIDEIDSLCGSRGGSGESESGRRLKTEILVQMQGVNSKRGKTLVLAATNTPYQLDQAIRRRFDRRIYIALPDERARTDMFKIHLGETPHSLTDADFVYLGSKTNGFSGSDVSVMVKDVMFQPIRKTQEATHFRTLTKNGDVTYEPCSPGAEGAFEATLEMMEEAGYAMKVHPPPISRGDFERVLVRARPTVSEDDLQVYQNFTKEFGEEG
jgi:vacuolar protein-sorting-associated protein 4